MRRSLPQILAFLGILIFLLFLLLGKPAPLPRITPETVSRLREAGQLNGQQPGYALRQLALAPDGNELIASTGYAYFLWHLSGGTEERSLDLRNSGGYTPRITFISGRPVALLSSWAGGLRLLDMDNGQVVQSLPDVTLQAYNWDAKGQLVVSTGEASLTVWDALTGAKQYTIPAPTGLSFWYSIPTISDDGHLLVAALQDQQTNQDRTLMLWDAISGEPVKTLGLFKSGVVWSLDFSDDNSLLAVGGGLNGEDGFGGLMQFWDVDTNTALGYFPVGHLPIEQVMISPDKHSVAAYGYGSIWLWDTGEGLKTGMPKIALESAVNLYDYSGMSFSPDGSLFAVGTRWGEIWIYDTISGQRIVLLKGHPERVSQVTFRDDGRVLISGSEDGLIRLWTAGRLSVPVLQPTMALPVPQMTPTMPPSS